jgi:hypothetical protein
MSFRVGSPAAFFAREMAGGFTIIADKPAGSLHAIAKTATDTVDLGVLTSTGKTARFYCIRASVRSMVLQRAGTNVASARLRY